MAPITSGLAVGRLLRRDASDPDAAHPRPPPEPKPAGRGDQVSTAFCLSLVYPLPSAFRLCIHCLLPAIRVCLHRLFNCLARAYPPPFQLSFARVSTAFSPPFLSISSAVTFSAWLDLTCANPGYRAEQYCTGSCLDMGSPDPVRDRNERPGRPSSETNTAFLLWRHRLYISGNTAYLLWKHRLCSRCCCRG